MNLNKNSKSMWYMSSTLTFKMQLLVSHPVKIHVSCYDSIFQCVMFQGRMTMIQNIKYN